MTIGDAAQAAGYPLVPGTASVREGADHHNATRDIIAEQIGQLGSAARWGVSQAMDPGTVPLRNQDGIFAVGIGTNGDHVCRVSLAQDFANAAAAAAAAGRASWYELDRAKQGFWYSDIWGRAVQSNFRSVYIQSDGLAGYASSRRATKQDFEVPAISTEQLRAVRWTLFRYRQAVAIERDGGERAQVMLGHIADDLHAAGLWHFVIYEGRGRDATPVGIHYEMLGMAALELAQRAWDQIDSLAARITRLEESPRG